MWKRILIIGLSLFSNLNYARAQACCSGGAPISFNLVFNAAPVQTLQFALSYDYNRLATLLAGSEPYQDNNRVRSTQTILFNAGYTFSPHFAIDAVFPYVIQWRKVSFLGTDNITQVAGVGDMVILPKLLIPLTRAGRGQLQIGAGIKLPSGKSAIAIDQITLNADMQPGSGSWDGIFMINYYQPLKAEKSLAYTATFNYRLAGTNPNYLDVQRYRFGDDFYWLNALSDQFAIKNAILSPTIGIRYRLIGKSAINDRVLDNTGGQWLTGLAGTSFQWPGLPAINLSGEFPLYNRVEGIQLSSTYRITVGIQHQIKTNNDH